MFNKSTLDILLQQCIFLQLVQSFLSEYWRCSVLDSNGLILQYAAQPAVTLEKKAKSNTSFKRPKWSTKTSRYIFFHYAINIPGTQWTCWYFFGSKCSVMIRCPLLKCTSLVSLMYITANHTSYHCSTVCQQCGCAQDQQWLWYILISGCHQHQSGYSTTKPLKHSV